MVGLMWPYIILQNHIQINFLKIVKNLKASVCVIIMPIKIRNQHNATNPRSAEI